jgi:hypothetical protein
MKYVPKLIPVIEPLNIHNLFEHTPLDYYRYGEYPRFIRPIFDRNITKTVWVKLKKEVK